LFAPREEPSMEDELVIYRRDGRIAHIIFNRPEQRNAVSIEMAAQLAKALERFDFDDEAWIAIISGNGPHFCVGVDVKQRFAGHGRAERDARLSAGPPTDGHLGRTANWKPVIGAVHGLAVGLGFNLALECDLLVSTTDARYMIAETKRGIAGGQLWAKLQAFMPSKITTELLLTGDPISAEPLYRLGLINRLVEPGTHVEAAVELAQSVLVNPPLPIRAHVRLTRWQWKRMCDEAALMIQPMKLHLTADFDEASAAFVEKRPGVFEGR
jgi:enoyl-CoA hydratase/carnithine racemase